MSVLYRTKQGDVLDAVVFKYYEGQEGTLEQVLEANRGLAKYDPVLPAGLGIALPDLPKPRPKEGITLW
ncbi:tail protein X [Halodesulfovibrio aestuarii]|uniref:Tail protein X n=1 Tax=Halodesulfovibrio aestuarii TaxID=126333 RepID=A0A8G2F7B3_9BACT|nr:tail protein X [Halodesulfovibrio aestuarii]SHI81906.1 P2-like prophage tail protein X [Halodesulfovibrio aestuarii]